MSPVDLVTLAATLGLFTQHQHQRVRDLRTLAQTTGQPAGTVPTGHNTKGIQP